MKSDDESPDVNEDREQDQSLPIPQERKPLKAAWNEELIADLWAYHGIKP